jgi:hypothetical protein
VNRLALFQNSIAIAAIEPRRILELGAAIVGNCKSITPNKLPLPGTGATNGSGFYKDVTGCTRHRQ